MQFYIVDAFAEEIFGGNGAGVVILAPGEPFPAETVMLKTAAELRFSETVFLQEQAAGIFKLRYFTPAAEVDLCGHATIGAFGALRDAGRVTPGHSYRIETLVGQLEVQVGEKSILMEMGEPRSLGTLEPAAITRLAKIMGVAPDQVAMPPQIISTGLPDIILPLKSKMALWQLAPDFPALTELSRQLEVVGVHAYALATPPEGAPGVTAYCRNFAPLYEIDEEAATGTANGALTYYLFSKGLVQAEGENTFRQGEIMQRPSRIQTRLTQFQAGPEAGRVRIYVGGNCQIFVQGEIRLK